ncbi:MAG: hypothetical protein A2847_01505 [Candidatus Sungbacteria bacterium RIFCSPHIGHO2_01_FULL_50_25]|uniref:Serine aminopeptidase S33 domain-containing protein n=1 Tax=Candidatus Sungbacteria bacterium RIFCSPHIGHO2_01_FULL_50_25 TaxID=1802265 RepID=A0A1G2K7L0_9BACT|nr:MAG: hypothetical protein A2847_01505 [Candidatus Sungbacteria bacterium RIFCSPHIGHO2_01_FULL_50_25]
MIPVLLTRIKTSDGITLEGVVVLPKKKGEFALVWIHGLTSRFSSGQTLIKELSSSCAKNQIAYFKFNTRGHDIVSQGTKKKLVGGAFEKFEECVRDIDAVIRLAKKLGYKKIILAGSSTGANKALYYQYKRKNPAVRGIILASAISDMSAWKTGDAKKMSRAIRIAKQAKNKDTLLPQEYGIYSAARYLSLFEAGHAEDVFPYHNPKATWKELKSIRVAVAVVIGSQDEHRDRPAKNIMDAFRKNAVSTRQNFSKQNLGGQAKSFSGIIIKGTNHGFQKHEQKLSREIIKWIHRETLR